MNNYDALYQAHWPDCYRRHLLGLADATPTPAHPIKLPHHDPAPKMGRPHRAAQDHHNAESDHKDILRMFDHLQRG